MNTIYLDPLTPRGEALIATHGDEWLVLEDRGTRMVITDLSEKHQMAFPNPHVQIKED